VALAGLMVTGCALAAGSGGAGTTAGTPLPPLRVSTTGSDEGRCTPDHPCQSVARAYRVARPGQVVEMEAGDYGDNGVPDDPSKDGGPSVQVRPLPGALVRWSASTIANGIGARWLEIRGVTGSFQLVDAQHVTLRDIDPRGIDANVLYVTGGAHIRVVGGDWGPSDPDDIAQIKPAGRGAPVPTDITIQGAYFHDATRRRDPSAHTDCLQVGGVRGLRVVSTRFVRCETESVFVSSWFGPPNTGLVLQNDVFSRTNVGYNTLVLGDVRGVTVRYSSFAQSPHVDPSTTRGVSFVANVGELAHYACVSGARYDRNVWSNARCGPSDRQAAPRFVGEDDLRLRPGAPGIDRGDPRAFPARDAAGRRRPAGRGPDAGAYEAAAR
jgi:hypothetical protein